VTAQQFDIIIVGGGMVGLTLACALGGSDLSIAVIETQTPQDVSAQDEYDLRVSAISRASQKVFENLGAWPHMQSRRISPYEHMQVWDAAGDGQIHFAAADLGVDVLGHIVENKLVQFGLWQALSQHKNVQCFCPAKISKIICDVAAQKIVLADGTELVARLLIGADGAHSQVREAAGITLEQSPYAQKGVVCVVQSSKHHQSTAWQRFLPTGPLAFLPLADGRCSIVWSASDSEADRLLTLDDEQFSRELEQAFDFTLGAVTGVGKRAAFPLIRRHAERYVIPGVALIGDAAHTIHPLAGQGVNLGILDAASLAQVLLDARRERRDIASLAVLRRFERWRRGENTLMMYSMSGFKWLFGSDQPALAALRNAGLNLVNSLGPVKHAFMRRAMGLDGDLPVLAKNPGF
jgi:2-octaprenylphenol hydroxylase